MSLNEGQKKMADTLEGILSVDAGPGTGKTHTVTQRYINILKSGADPSKVLLLTFTRNAAGEMAERIRGGLKKAAKECGDDDLARTLVKACDEVRASTFDAYCLRIVLSSPDAVNDFFGIKESLSRGAKLVENETLNADDFRSFYAGFSETYGHLYRKGADYPALVAGDIRSFYGLLVRLMSFGIIPMKDDYEWFGDGLKRLRGDRDRVRALLDEANAEGELAVKRPDDKMFAGNVPDGDGGVIYDSKPKGQKMYVSDGYLDQIADEDRDGLIEFVRHVYYEYIRHAVRTNRLTFPLVKIMAFVALYGSQFVRDQNSAEYLMVDEFQDTDEIQLKICMMLLSRSNLCVVGDWKQGIYGFRNATVDNLMFFGERSKDVCHELGDLVRFDIDGVRQESIPFTVNYRSSQKIIDRSFMALSAKGKKDEKVVSKGTVVPLVSHRCSDENENCDLYRQYTDYSYYCAGDSEKEYDAICDMITEYVCSGKYGIVEDDGTVRAPRFGDIAVLFRPVDATCRFYEKACARHIPVFLQGDMEIMSSKPGKIALAWLRLLNDISDKRAISAILSYEGMSMSQIKAVYAAAEGGSFRDALPERIIREYKFLRSKMKRPNELLTSVFAFYSLPEDPEYADIVQAIINVLSSAYTGSLITVSDMIRLMEEDIENGTKYPLDAVLGTDAVTVQTMHKSKGLEYPIVVVGGLNQREMPLPEISDSIFIFDDRYGFGLRCKKEVTDGTNGTHGIVDSWRTFTGRKAIPDSYDEERRLLFVSMTRAKQYLFMTSGKTPSQFYKDLCPDDGHCPVPYPVPDAVRMDAVSETPEIPPYAKRRTNIAVHDIMKYVPGESGGSNSAEYGTKVHEAAQLLALGKKCSADYPELEYIRGVLGHLNGARIRAELDCALPVNDATIRGVIDLLAEYDDRIEIHDWKTGTDRRNHEEYVLQLSVYAHAVMQATGKPVRCFVDYVTQKESVEVTPFVTLDAIAEKAADFLASGETKV